MKKVYMVILTFSLVLLSGCATPPMVVYCEPGHRPVPIYQDPSMLYKGVENNYELSIKGLQSSINKLDAKFSLGDGIFKKTVVELQEKLDQKNIEHNNTLKTLVLSQQLNPCDAGVNSRLFKYLGDANRNSTALEAMKIKLNSKMADEEINNIIIELEEINKKIDINKSTEVECGEGNEISCLPPQSKYWYLKKEYPVSFTIVSDLFFQSASAQLSEAAEMQIAAIGDRLSKLKGGRIFIIGGADSKPVSKKNIQFRDNYDLSLRRAESVANKLKANYNIDSAVLGMSDIQSRANNNTTPCNRKVDIFWSNGNEIIDYFVDAK